MNSMITVQLEIPEEWASELQDQATLMEILSLGIRERRFEQALGLYQKGVGSIGYVAELVGLPERVLIEEARRRGVLPHYDERFVEQDLTR
jgi:predicted HTH domain antitoxin